MIQSRGVLTKKDYSLTWPGATPSFWPGSAGPWPNGYLSASYAYMYRRHNWVSTNVNKIANASARLPLKVYERDVQGRPEARGHPYSELLRRPSQTIDPFSFWVWTVSTLNIEGEAFWIKMRDRGGRPVALAPVHPSKIVNDYEDDGMISWYYRDYKGRQIEFERRDLVHFRLFNPETLHRGMSPLEPLRATLENEEGARRANSALWRNGGRPSVTLQHPGTLSEPAMARLSAQWRDIHGGVDNWAKAAILEEGMTANVMPLNVEELQYIEARKLNREEVCAAYDVPPPVVHILDKATFSNITEQMRSMYRDTMAPKLGSLESTLEFELRDGRMGGDAAPDFGDTVYAEFLMDEVLRGDFEARAAAYQAADYLTLAEKREMENRPFIAGTDHIFLNSATLPLGENGTLVQPGANVDPDKPMSAAELALNLQKIYLAVGVVISADEARDILNRNGAGLSGPAPIATRSGAIEATATPLEPSVLRAVMGRLSRAKALGEIDPEALIAGLNTEAIAVLQQFVSAQLAGDTVDGFKGRLRALTVGKDH
jgi:HK97 family phage portal protein